MVNVKQCVLIPAYNEQDSLALLLREVRLALPGLPVVVINDGSTDATALVARKAGAIVLDLPCNLGVGGAIQAGFQFAVEQGFDRVIRIDGDGQHPPSEIHKLLQIMDREGVDLVVGSRFGIEQDCISTRFRYFGIRLLSGFLSRICRSPVADPTSGFWLVNRPLMNYFAKYYPTDYPEPEARALLRRQGYRMTEVPVLFRPRMAGQSSIRTWGAFYFALKVGLALLVDRVRPINRMYARDGKIHSA
jgi:glycosyltransferase involved in cell wall biosynthesis